MLDVYKEIARAKKEGRYDPEEKRVFEVIEVRESKETPRPANLDHHEFSLHLPEEITWENIDSWDLNLPN